MTLPVFRVADVPAPGARLELDGDEGRHAVVVRRIRVGEQIVLTDGRGRAATCEVLQVDKRTLTARVCEVREDPPASPRIVVAQAIPKGDRGELAVELLTEIGVDRIVPWAAARCVAVWRGDRATKGVSRWRARAHEAAKQSRRTWFPEVGDVLDTAGLVALAGEADTALVLHEDAGTALSAVEPPTDGTLLLVVGPEGGITPEEVEALESAGAVAVRLGRGVLRTSTAGLAAAAALLPRTGRWG